MSHVHHLFTIVLALAAGPNLLAADVLVSSRFTDQILRYDAQSGAFVGVFASGPELDNPNGITFGPDGNLYAGLGDGASVLKYDGLTGDFIGEFITPGDGGLSSVRGIEFGPDGDLYVASGATDQVLRYDGGTGAFIGVAAAGDGLDGPIAMAFGPDGLYVGAALSNQVFVFDDGVFQRSFNAGGAHGNAAGLLFNTNGDLLVTQTVTDEVLRFNPLTGAFLGVFATQRLRTPIYMELSPENELVVGSFANDRVIRFDSLTGELIDSLVPSGRGGLDGTHDIAFMPIPEPGTLGAVALLFAVAACARKVCR